jgi:hypothetical protein
MCAIFGAWFLLRRHNKLDGTTAKQVVEEAKDAVRVGAPGMAWVLYIGWGIKTFFLPGLVVPIGVACGTFIAGICGGLNSEQAVRLLCILVEGLSGRVPQLCSAPPR